jgi:MFS family permease
LSKEDSAESVAQDKLLGIRNVIRLGYVSLFTDISTEMILGVLPFFIVLDLGASAAVLGIIEGTAEAMNYLFRVFAGVLTDKIGKRKPLIIIGYGLSTIAKPLFALTGSWGQAFAVRAVDRAGKGTRTSPRDALISDSVSKAEAGKGFGIHRSLDQVGAVLGPLVAYVAIPFIGFRGIFWISFIPGLASLIILVFFVSDSRRSARRASTFENARSVLSKEFILLLAVLGIFSIGAYDFSFILLKAGTLGIKGGDITLVYATLNLATVFIGLPIGIFADKAGKIPALCIGYLVFAVTSYLGFYLNSYWGYAYLIAFLFGSYLSISETVMRALVPDFTKPEVKGTAYAFYYMMIGVCSLIANSVFGALWTSFSQTAAFEFSIVTSTAGVAALIIFLLVRRRRIHL